LLTVPRLGVRDQVIAELLVPATTALNHADCPAVRVVEAGVTEMDIALEAFEVDPLGVRLIVALAFWVGLARLVAVRITVWELGMELGAV
jgi:hypothetical protein